MQHGTTHRPRPRQPRPWPTKSVHARAPGRSATVQATGRAPPAIPSRGQLANHHIIVITEAIATFRDFGPADHEARAQVGPDRFFIASKDIEVNFP
jgi:hypothetical protein